MKFDVPHTVIEDCTPLSQTFVKSDQLLSQLQYIIESGNGKPLKNLTKNFLKPSSMHRLPKFGQIKPMVRMLSLITWSHQFWQPSSSALKSIKGNLFLSCCNKMSISLAILSRVNFCVCLCHIVAANFSLMKPFVVAV